MNLGSIKISYSGHGMILTNVLCHRIIIKQSVLKIYRRSIFRPSSQNLITNKRTVIAGSATHIHTTTIYIIRSGAIIIIVGTIVNNFTVDDSTIVAEYSPTTT